MGSESISNVMDISTADDTDNKTPPISLAEMNDATVNLSRNCTHITIEKLVCFLQYLEKIHVKCDERKRNFHDTKGNVRVKKC